MLVHPQFDPVALALGPVQIHWYGLTYLAAFGLFLWLAARRVRLPHFAAAGWTRRDVEDLLFLGVLGVVVGGVLALVRRRNAAFPFGPALAASTVLAVVFSDQILGLN